MVPLWLRIQDCTAGARDNWICKPCPDLSNLCLRRHQQVTNWFADIGDVVSVLDGVDVVGIVDGVADVLAALGWVWQRFRSGVFDRVSW